MVVSSLVPYLVIFPSSLVAMKERTADLRVGVYFVVVVVVVVMVVHVVTVVIGVTIGVTTVHPKSESGYMIHSELLSFLSLVLILTYLVAVVGVNWYSPIV